MPLDWHLIHVFKQWRQKQWEYECEILSTLHIEYLRFISRPLKRIYVCYIGSAAIDLETQDIAPVLFLTRDRMCETTVM